MKKTPVHHQTIRDWSVIGHHRVTGRVYNRPGQADGGSIITSPVSEVRLMGNAGYLVVITEQGSVYWLDSPSETFGLDRAEEFVVRMMQRMHLDILHHDTRPADDGGLVVTTEFYSLPRNS